MNQTVINTLINHSFKKHNSTTKCDTMSISRAIEFESNRFKVCYSGRLLQGKVNIFNPVDTQIKAIYITFVGKGFCKWDTGGSKSLTGSKKYLEEKVYLLRSSNDSTVLPPGGHQYPFSIQLSSKLPTSYEGTYGYIRYVATLYIETQTQKDEPLKETFTVIRPLNLNNKTSFRVPIEKRLCAKFNQFCLFFCWRTSALKIFGRLPVSGYCPGQTMNLKLDVINNSDQDVQHILVHFIKEVTYRSNDGSTKIERVLLVGRKAEGCRANRNGIQSTRINIIVPSLPPSNYSTDNICRLHYFVRVTAITGFCHRDPTFRIPVIVGTYPILDELYSASVDAVNSEHSTNIGTTYVPNAPSSLSLDSSDLPPYPDADPPTYEEAMRSTETTNEDFVPKYPTFKRGTKYASQV